MFTINEIEKITDAVISNGDVDKNINKFNISVKNHFKDELYIPIFWREDRHKYIIDSVKDGAIGYMISTNFDGYKKIIAESKILNPQIIILEVADVNDSIYKMASYLRKKYANIPIISVTGSVGKTSTCNIISGIIRKEKRVLSDVGNNNTKPLLSYLMLDIEDYEIAVLEAGISDKNIMEPISTLLEPSIVVINNIGTAHIERLGSKKEILEEKLLLAKHMKDKKTIFLNNDDPMLKKVKLGNEYNVIKYSSNEVNQIKQNEGIITFETNLYGNNTIFRLHSYAEHDISNAISAIRIGEFLNINEKNIVNGISEYRNVDRRFNVIKKDNYIIIDDTYNASLASMKSGLISANKIQNCNRKIAVLGEMLELGKFSKRIHSKVGEVFKNIDFDILYTQGENTKYICETAKLYMKNKEIINFSNQDELIKKLLSELKSGDLIYLKASKNMHFDVVVEKLKEINVKIK